ncbi:MAG: acyl carrier protein [Anaerolineaceae bacterium]|nr:acyl carrier protein [Anaerolineaceae bacterium]
MTREEILFRLNKVFQDVFDDEELTVTDQTSPEDIDDWDSLAQITLIAAVENEFGIRFPVKKALQMKTAGQIADAASELL